MKYGKIPKSKVPNRGQSLEKIDAIIMNQIICILTTNFIISFGLDRTNGQNITKDVKNLIFELSLFDEFIFYQFLCYTFSYLLTYFVLSTFFWSFWHGIILFQIFIKRLFKNP